MRVEAFSRRINKGKVKSIGVVYLWKFLFKSYWKTIEVSGKAIEGIVETARKPMREDNSISFCPICGAKVKADANYCIKCGQKIR